MLQNFQWNKLSVHVILLAASCFCLFPFFWMTSTSIKSPTEVFMYPPVLFPESPLWSNYTDVFKSIQFLQFSINTVAVSLIATVGTVIVCPLVAYGFAKLEFKGRDLLFAVTIAVMMIPNEVTMIPLFLVYQKLGLINTQIPLYLHSFFGVPFYIFLLRQFLRGIPDDLLDSARMDGANELLIYIRIVLPLSVSAVLSVGLFQFMASWTDFMGPLLYLNDPAKYTLSLGIQQFYKEYGTEWGMLMAASTLMTLPIILLFFLLQKTFIQGITFTGIKS